MVKYGLMTSELECPFKHGEVCDHTCPANDSVRKYLDVDAARAEHLKRVNNPLAAFSSRAVEAKYDVPARKLINEALQKCHRINFFERHVLIPIRDFIVVYFGY